MIRSDAVDRDSRSQTTLNRLLTRWGGLYVLRMQSVTQLISFLVAIIGIYYILVAADLNQIQTIELFACVFVFLTLVNLLFPAFTAMATINARIRLDVIYKGKPVPPSISEDELENLAWQEINSLPWRYTLVEAATAYLLVVLPAVLFMRWIGHVDVVQAIHIATGGLVSGTAVVIQNVLFLERILGPVRNALLPRDKGQQANQTGFRLQPRIQLIITVLILVSIIFLGMDEFISRQIDSYILSIMIIILGLYLGRMLTKSVTMPVTEIIKTMERFRDGDYSARASILSSDEISQLTIQLNQLLNQLQISQYHLEKQVEQRTADLNTKTTRLQAAAQISRDAASARDVNTLLGRTVNLITERFGFYHTGIFLVDPAGEYAVLQAASSEGGSKMLERGHRLEVGQQGIVGATAYQNRPHIAMDIGQDAVFFKNPDLPLTRSEAAIPLTARGKVIGVLDIQSTEQTTFSQDDIELLQTLADQIALAIQNAQLIEESQSTLAQLESTLSENVKRVWRSRAGGQKRAYRYTPTGLSTVTQGEKEKTKDIPSVGGAKINIPVTLRGQTIGNIALTRKGDNAWSNADQALALEVANQVGLALENSRLLQDAQQKAFQEQSLSELTARLGRSIDSDILLQTTVRELHQLPNVTEVSVYLIPPENPASGDKS
jgi:GAF domain-containing protein/HAMP domain-containing protein